MRGHQWRLFLVVFCSYAVWPASAGRQLRATPAERPRTASASTSLAQPRHVCRVGAAGALLLLRTLLRALLGSLLGSFLLGHSTSSVKQGLATAVRCTSSASLSPRVMKPAGAQAAERPQLMSVTTRDRKTDRWNDARPAFNSFLPQTISRQLCYRIKLPLSSASMISRQEEIGKSKLAVGSCQ
jgi:hypothetical protein